MIINDFKKSNINFNTSQMEQWSILSNIINYVLYNRNPIDYQKLDVKPFKSKNHKSIYVKLEEDIWQLID